MSEQDFATKFKISKNILKNSLTNSKQASIIKV